MGIFPVFGQLPKSDLIAIGGTLNTHTLIEAYSKGIFPWPIEPDAPMLWFSPKKRAILNFSKLHVSKSLKKFLKKQPFCFSIDQAFSEIIQTCAKNHEIRSESTWITKKMQHAYCALFKKGYAHSFEVWDPYQKTLAGGLYGVCIAGYFSAESMFYLKPNSSKAALLFLIDLLKKKEHHWMDIQMLTPHLKHFGAEEISRKEFLEKIRKEKFKKKIPF